MTLEFDLDIAPGRDGLSTLRHDLVTPINHILGYCEILVEDAEHEGKVYRTRSLRAVQDLGRLALGVIDDAFLPAIEAGRPVDAAALRRALLPPCTAIIEACHAIAESSAAAPDQATLADDLARIRAAAAQLLDQAARLAGAATE